MSCSNFERLLLTIICSWLSLGDEDMKIFWLAMCSIPGKGHTDGDLGAGDDTALRCSGTEFERESKGDVDRFSLLGSTSYVGRLINSFSNSLISFAGHLLRLWAEDFIPNDSSKDWPNPAMWPWDFDFFFHTWKSKHVLFRFPIL